jgi:hypothetical protein
MKYIFRGNIVFEYDPTTKRVTQHKVHDRIAYTFEYFVKIFNDQLTDEVFNQYFSKWIDNEN